MEATLALPHWLEGTLAGGLIMLGSALVYLFWRIQIKKQGTDLSIDARGSAFQAMILKQLDDTQAQNAALHDRNRELNDRLAAAYTQTVELAMKHGSEVLAAVNQTRAEHSDYARKQEDTIKRVYSVLDETKTQLARCEERDRVWADTQQATAHRIEAMERIVGVKVANTTLTVTTTPVGATITPP